MVGAMSLTDRFGGTGAEDLKSGLKRTSGSASRTSADVAPRRHHGGMGRRSTSPLRVLLAAALFLLCLPALASADPYLPDAGKVFAGVAAGKDLGDFTARTGKRPAIWQQFIQWGGNYHWAIDWPAQANTRVMLHISTAGAQDKPDTISPGQIARGDGDGWALGLAADLAAVGTPVYVRPFGEMNNCHNGYAAYDCTGRRRDADHSQANLLRAYKRLYLIMHGGQAADINARLGDLNMPPLRTGATELPAVQVAFVWSPMTAGSPQIPALSAKAYWPGGAWVDWVGTSFYSKFPNFKGLEPYYRSFAVGPRKPFMFAEWAIWGGDNPGFARQLFAWTASHTLTRAIIYNQGYNPSGPFRLRFFPAAQQVIRGALNSSRYSGSPG
jgi:hypothetical protein